MFVIGLIFDLENGYSSIFRYSNILEYSKASEYH